MKKLIVKLLGISLLAFYFLSCIDDGLKDHFATIPTVQFKVAKDSVQENDREKVIILTFSQPFKYDATIPVLVDSSQVKYFSSSPTPVDGVITLLVKKNDSQALLKLKPKNDDTFSGTKLIELKLTRLHNEYVLGANSKFRLSISDDDAPSGLPKGYDVSGGSWRIKKTYEYNEKARVSKVKWETYTPYKRTGTDTYYYNQWDQLTRINTGSGHDILYSYVDARIFLAQRMENGVLDGYTNFDYDDHARLAGYQIFDSRSDGTFINTAIVELFYFPNGNLFKSWCTRLPPLLKRNRISSQLKLSTVTLTRRIRFP